MSAPLSPAARTRTSISSVPGTGSGCSSMRISPSRIVAAFIACEAYPSASLEQGHALDVASLRKHVHRAHLHQTPARLDQLGGIGGEGRRVAGHVHDALGRGVDDAAHHLL